MGGRGRGSIPVSWLGVALWGEQWGKVWMARLHPRGLWHGQNLASLSPEVAIVLKPCSLPSSTGLLQVCELAFLCGNVFSSSWDLLSVFTVGAEQLVPDESVQSPAAHVTDLHGVRQAQTSLGRGWGWRWPLCADSSLVLFLDRCVFCSPSIACASSFAVPASS